MALRKRLTNGLIAFAAAAPVITAAALPASAFGRSEICGNGGTGYCLNAWGGGPAVKMYNGGVANDNFAEISVAACDEDVYVNQFCANEWGSGGSSLVAAGAHLGRIQYNGPGPYNGYCAGTGGSGTAVLTSCGDITDGGGAGNGVIMAVLTPSGCDGTNRELIVDRYWSSSQHNNALSYIWSGGNPGLPAYMNKTLAATCWGQRPF
jgi:hypothetical protein